MINEIQAEDKTYAAALKENASKTQILTEFADKCREPEFINELPLIEAKLQASFQSLILEEKFHHTFDYYKINANDYFHAVHFKVLVEDFTKEKLNFSLTFHQLFSRIYGTNITYQLSLHTELQATNSSPLGKSGLYYNFQILVDKQTIAEFEVVSLNKKSMKNCIALQVLKKISKPFSQILLYEAFKNPQLIEMPKAVSAGLNPESKTKIAEDKDEKNSRDASKEKAPQPSTSVRQSLPATKAECYADIQDIKDYEQIKSAVIINEDTFRSDFVIQEIENFMLDFKEMLSIQKTCEKYFQRFGKTLNLKLFKTKDKISVVVKFAKTLLYKFVINLPPVFKKSTDTSVKNIALIAFLVNYFFPAANFLFEEAELIAEESLRAKDSTSKISATNFDLNGKRTNIEADHVQNENSLPKSVIFENFTIPKSNDKRIKDSVNTPKFPKFQSPSPQTIIDSRPKFSDLIEPPPKAVRSAKALFFDNLEKHWHSRVIFSDTMNIEKLQKRPNSSSDFSKIDLKSMNAMPILASNFVSRYGQLFVVKAAIANNRFDVQIQFIGPSKRSRQESEAACFPTISFKVDGKSLLHATELSLLKLFEIFFPGEFEHFLDTTTSL
jgi:hypothetical protein